MIVNVCSVILSSIVTKCVRLSQLGSRSARPRVDPAGTRLRLGPRQEASRRSDPLDPRTHAPPDTGTIRRGWGGCGGQCRGRGRGVDVRRSCVGVM